MGVHKKERNEGNQVKEIERIQGKVLKRIFKLLVSKSNKEILMETGVRSAEQRIQYATLMLYNDIKNCNEEDRETKKNFLRP